MKSVETVKSVLLTFLVLLSMYLTTQLWFDIAFWEIFFPNEVKEQVSMEEKYDESKLIMPMKIVINSTGEGACILIPKEQHTTAIFESLLTEQKNMIKTYMNKDLIINIKQYDLTKLKELRNSKSIEFIYQVPINHRIFEQSFQIEEGLLGTIKNIDEVIVMPDEEKICFLDMEQELIVECKITIGKEGRKFQINSVENYKKTYGIFMNEINQGLYTCKMVIPTTSVGNRGMILKSATEQSEISESQDVVREFFNTTEVKSMIDQSGAIIYTDGQKKGLRVEKNGTIEFIKSDVETIGSKALSIEESFEIAVDFINIHMGFPEGAYLETVKQIEGKEKLVIGYKFSFGYCIEHTPIVHRNGIGAPIEIEVIGREVRRYQRSIKKVKNEAKETSIISAMSALDVAIYAMREKDDLQNVVEDIYLAYSQYANDKEELEMILVWVVNVRNGNQYNNIIIDATTSNILQY